MYIIRLYHWRGAYQSLSSIKYVQRFSSRVVILLAVMPPFKVQTSALNLSAFLLRTRLAPQKLSVRHRLSSSRQTLPSHRFYSSSITPKSPQHSQAGRESSLETVSSVLHDADPSSNSLLSPVHIPEDPNGVLNERHPATSILAHSALVVTRQLELMNIMVGFEQANKYVIMDPQGQHIGFMAETDLGMGSMLKRQMFNTHRSFTTHVFDRYGKEVLRVRPEKPRWKGIKN